MKFLFFIILIGFVIILFSTVSRSFEIREKLNRVSAELDRQRMINSDIHKRLLALEKQRGRTGGKDVSDVLENPASNARTQPADQFVPPQPAKTLPSDGVSVCAPKGNSRPITQVTPPKTPETSVRQKKTQPAPKASAPVAEKRYAARPLNTDPPKQPENSAEPEQPAQVNGSGPQMPTPVLPDSFQAAPPNGSREKATTFVKEHILALIGVTVLLLGLGYLVTYVWQRGLLTSTMKVSLAVVISVAILILGFVLLPKKRTYSLILQAGGFSGLYISVFAAGITYGLFMSVAALVVLIALCTLVMMTAAVENAFSLAMLACIGAYSAPYFTWGWDEPPASILIYFTVISVMIVVVKFFRPWSELSLLAVVAFVFSISVEVISSYAQYPGFFTAGFALVLINVALLSFVDALVHARRGTVFLESEVVTGLLIIVPSVCGYIVASSLLWNDPKLVKFGVLFVWGLVYSVVVLPRLCGKILRNRGIAPAYYWSQGIAFVFLAPLIGVQSVSLIGILWALMGASLALVGLSSNSAWIHRIGLGITTIGLLIAVLAIMHSTNVQDRRGALLVTLGVIAAMITIRWQRVAHWDTADIGLPDQMFQVFAAALIGGSSIAFSGEASREIYHSFFYDMLREYLGELSLFTLLSVMGILTALTWLALGKAVQWRYLQSASVCLWVSHISLVSGYVCSLGFPTRSTVTALGMVIWLVLGALFYAAQKMVVYLTDLPDLYRRPLSLLTIYSTILQGYLFIRLLGDLCNFRFAITASITAFYMTAVLVVATIVWSFTTYRDRHLGTRSVAFYTTPFVAYLAVFFIFGISFDGRWSLFNNAYIPIANPVDLAQIVALVIIAWWTLRTFRTAGGSARFRQAQTWRIGLFISLAIIWYLNILFARCVSGFFGVAWNGVDLMGSVLLQVTLTVFWTVSALTIMVLASRRHLRFEWFAGMVVLIVALTKLIVNDASDELMWRAVTLILVALFILAVAFVNPLPAKASESVGALFQGVSFLATDRPVGCSSEQVRFPQVNLHEFQLSAPQPQLDVQEFQPGQQQGLTNDQPPSSEQPPSSSGNTHWDAP